MGSRSSLRGDVFGGLTAAVIALPLALAFGVSAFAPLGPASASTGALVGLLGAIYTGFFAALFGGTPVQVTGPTGPMTVVVTALLTDLVRGRPSEEIPAVLVLMGAAIVFGGITQVALGAAGGGKIVKFIPYPVVAGFMNGIAVIIFLGQLRPFLGVTGPWSSIDLAHAWVPIGVGTITIAGVLITKKLSKRVPASLVGLGAGIATYLALAFLHHAPLQTTDNPLVVGPIPNPFGSLDQIKAIVPAFKLTALTSVGVDDLRKTLSAGMALGVLGSIDSLLTSVVADSVTHSRHDSRRELIGQGIGNIVSGLGGGLAGAGATVRTLVNVQAGGRARRSGMLHAVAILLVVVLLGRPAGWIPLSALAGILFVTAVSMVDFYSLRLVQHRRVRYEFIIMLVVTVVTVTVDLMVAVAIGVGIAAVLFIWQQSRIGVVHRKLRGSEAFSRRIRRDEDIARLRDKGDRTLAYELSGSLFFGTTDALRAEVEADAPGADRFIFDFARVRDVDLSGVQILLSIVERLRAQGKNVALSGLANVEAARPGVHELFVQLEVLSTVGEEHLHATLDLAREAYEDELLEDVREHRRGMKPMALRDFEAFAALTDGELERFASLLEVKDVVEGDVLFAEGDAAEAFVLVREGRLSITKRGAASAVRLAALGRGASWGMRALVHGGKWQTTLRAETDAKLFLLAANAIDELSKNHPAACEHLERELLRSAVRRIDLLTTELVHLEEA